MIEFHEAIFDWFLCSFGKPSHTLVAYDLEKGGILLHAVVEASYGSGSKTAWSMVWN